MGALASGLQSLGQSASDFGTAKFAYSDWQQQQRANRLNEIIQGLRIQQIQNQLKQQQLPQSLGLFKGAQGEYAGSFNPQTGETSAKMLIPSAPGYHDIKIGEDGFPYGVSDATGAYEPIPNKTGAKFQTVHADDPVKELKSKAIDAFLKGDVTTAQKYLDIEQKVSSAARATPKTNEIDLLLRAQRGDPEATGALRQLQQNRLDVMKQRGIAYGLGRLQHVYDPDLGRDINMLGYDIIAAQNQGKVLLPAGAMPMGTLIAAQRLVSESTPAIAGVQRNLKAFDNPADRLIFARILSSNPLAEGQDPHAWLGTVLNQALTQGLSPEGRQLVVADRRLNETISTLRATLGLPATNSATSLTLQMIPGPATPDSAFAKEQLNQLQQVITQAVGTPALGGGAALGNPQSPAASSTPPPGAKIRDYTQVGP